MVALPLGVSLRDGAMAVGIGLLGAAAFPPVGAWPLTLVSIALLLHLLHNQDAETGRNCGLLFGLTYGLGTMYWFFAVFGVLAIPLFGLKAAYFGLLAVLIAMTRTYPPLLRAALVALFAVAIEWLRGDAWYLRFPWYTPLHALARAPAWIAPVRWLGTYGLSLVIWFIAAAGAFGRPYLWVAFLVLPAASLLLPEMPNADCRVLLVQTEQEDRLAGIIRRIPAQKVDLAVLPELAYISAPQSVLDQAHEGPSALAHKVSSPVVFGAVEGNYFDAKFSNVAAVISAKGELLGTFPKQRPVPLMKDGVPGQRQPVFPVEHGVLGVGICYDLDAPAIAAALAHSGATVFVVPTYDALWWTRIQHVHHELLLRLRAVENDRWVLRAASSGRSEVINPCGSPSDDGVPIGDDGYLVLPFGHRDTTALGGQLAFLGPAAAVGTTLFLVIAVIRRLRFARPLRSAPSAPEINPESRIGAAKPGD
jgi:apolipoprotein N-acyltransferase